MITPIAVQLYTVRELLETDFENIVRQIADIGYLGVETYDFSDTVDMRQASRLFQELGLTVVGSHLPLPIGNDKNRVLDTMSVLGGNRLICSYIPPERYRDAVQTQQVCDQLNEAAQVAFSHGLRFGVHNHWWEFESLEGQFPYRAWLKNLNPEIFFELDIYWIETAGLESTEIVTLFGSRAELLHIKDGPASDSDAAMVAVGAGSLNIPNIIKANAGNADWFIVELDRCDTDMMTAVKESYQYLVGEGLAVGR